MSPTLVQTPIDYSHLPKTEFRTKLEKKPKSASFPDGIKTTGQQPPLYEEVRPYSDFPKNITGLTAWTKDDFSGSPEKEALWKHPFTEQELEELSTAAEQYLASGRSLTEMSKVRADYTRGIPVQLQSHELLTLVETGVLSTA
jgi:hypothetical protein